METTVDHHQKVRDMDIADIWRLLKERALESTDEGVVISDCSQPDMPIIYANNAFTAMTGYGYDEVVGRNCRFLQGEDTGSPAAQTIRKAIAAQESCKVEILNYRKDGTPFWNRLSITPVRDDEGRTTHFIGIQSNVTRRRDAEDSLRAVNKQLKRDLQAAAQVQQAQLPKDLPEVDGFKFGWRYRPCQELAGDALNILPIDDSHIAVYVLDVSGHGVRAALESFSLNLDLRPRQDGPAFNLPKQVLARLNVKYPMEAETGMFFTILYGVLDTETGEFTYASAGHPGPVLMKKGQPLHIIETRSFPIGVSADAEYTSETIQLEEGDRLILYTDGVVEALSSRDIPFGEERFLKTLARNRDEPIDGCLDAVMKSMENWACHVDLRDDLSLVGIEAHG
ncbi:MAG: PP2C family protein-serine/threonine phosphatase [Planctomycetota bacterium]|jgi:PAS domain S-box-containing protein